MKKRTKIIIGVLIFLTAFVSAGLLYNFQQPYHKQIKTLSPLAYYITQLGGTEAPFNNEYWDNEEVGIYVDVISGEALFSSQDKYKSGSGWPSFTKPISERVLSTKIDTKLGQVRTALVGKDSKAHLGHVFDDGPADKGGKRYCLNSAALRFVPASELSNLGYEKYVKIFAE